MNAETYIDFKHHWFSKYAVTTKLNKHKQTVCTQSFCSRFKQQRYRSTRQPIEAKVSGQRCWYARTEAPKKVLVPNKNSFAHTLSIREEQIWCWNIQKYLHKWVTHEKSLNLYILRCRNIAIQLYTSFKCAHFPRSSVGVPESIFNNRGKLSMENGEMTAFLFANFGQNNDRSLRSMLCWGDPMSTNPRQKLCFIPGFLSVFL